MAVHVATRVPIVFFYRNRIRDLVIGFLRREAFALDYAGKLVVGSFPAGGVGIASEDWITAQFSSPVTIGCALVTTGFSVASARFTAPRATGLTPDWRQAPLIRCAQAVASLTLPDLAQTDRDGLAAIGIGAVAALVSGLAAITLFVRMLDRQLFHVWSWYGWSVGGAFLVWTLAA